VHGDDAAKLEETPEKAMLTQEKRQFSRSQILKGYKG
jgi:hypothetical protein